MLCAVCCVLCCAESGGSHAACGPSSVNETAHVLQNPGHSARAPVTRAPPRCSYGLGADEGGDARDVRGDAAHAGAPPRAGARIQPRTATLAQAEALSTPLGALPLLSVSVSSSLPAFPALHFGYFFFFFLHVLYM